MKTQFRCKNEGRRKKVEESNALNGIDYLEVASDDQKALSVFFVHNLPGQTGSGPALTTQNVVIEGGARITDIVVKGIVASANVLTVSVSARGDFSTYTLRIVTSPANLEPPPGFDPQLSAIDFSFKAACPSEFDCEQQVICPPAKLPEPEIDYLAKDYASFRRLILDRMAALMPDWNERTPADMQIALVEMMAYVGDYLSYFQDAVATEAYLGSARQRISTRRHARLLDYFVHDGCNARTWVCVEVAPGGDADGKILPAGTTLLTNGSGGQRLVAADLGKALAEGPTVFETVHELELHSAHNSMSFYTWSDIGCCLPRGATRATLLNRPALALEAGDVLLFEELISPTTGLQADSDPEHRHAVRLTEARQGVDPLDNTPVMEIAWHDADALPFPLCLTSLIDDNAGPPAVKEISVARGNVTLADHGLTLEGEPLEPALVPPSDRYRPQLRNTGITFAVPYDHQAAVRTPASLALVQDAHEALPAGGASRRELPLTLNDGELEWVARRDLLASDRFAADVVVELESDGGAHLRFGDDILGKRPTADSTLTATYRVGNGRAGNIGAETLTRIVSSLTGIRSVRNVIAATGGIDAETMEEVRQYAPQAFRTQQRAVTEADWAEVAGRHPAVQQAAARFRWTGSWYTVFITIDRIGGLPARGDEEFRRELRAHLERFRIAGYDLEITDPVFVPLDILMLVCSKPGYFAGNIKKSLQLVFSRQELPDGGRGFFHPDNFTFGQPVYLSRIYQAAMEVAGVASVELTRFQRWGRVPNNELANAVLTPGAFEIIRLDNDPNFPENGKIAFDVQGGL